MRRFAWARRTSVRVVVILLAAALAAVALAPAASAAPKRPKPTPAAARHVKHHPAGPIHPHGGHLLSVGVDLPLTPHGLPGGGRANISTSATPTPTPSARATTSAAPPSRPAAKPHTSSAVAHHRTAHHRTTPTAAGLGLSAPPHPHPSTSAAHRNHSSATPTKHPTTAPPGSVRLVTRLLPGNESALLVALLIVTAVGVALIVRLSGRRDSRHS